MRSCIRCIILASVCLVSAQRSHSGALESLLITSDFGSVRRCRTLEEINAVTRIMISANPDIVALDATANGLVNYQSAIGVMVPGSNLDSLMESGVEPFAIVVDTLRAHGLTVLANVRMNDHHGRESQWTPWEREHTAWSLGRDTGARDWKSIGALRQMDYAQEGVRRYRRSILEEIVRTFPVDGLQLDFGRTAPFLSEPKSDHGHFLTDYVRSVRELLNEASRKGGREVMLLGVIVPWDLDFCAREGMEISAWVEEGLVDYVSPAEWYYADWNLPLDRWRTLLQGTGCKLYPCTPGNVSPYQEFEYGSPSLLGENHVLDPPKIRAIAENLLSQDPDGLAFYNLYTFDFGAYYPSLRVWIDPTRNRNMPKQYLFCRRLLYQPNERQTFDLGVAFKRQQLVMTGDYARQQFRFATDLVTGLARLRCVLEHFRGGDSVIVRLNGVAFSPAALTTHLPRSQGDPPHDARIWECEVPAAALVLGNNLIEWELAGRAEGATTPIAVGEFEILVEP